MVERFNRTIENFLKIVVSDHQDDWDKCIPPFLLAYRSAVHESTGKTPAQVVFGRELRLPVDLLTGQPEKNEILEEYVSKLAERLQLAHEEARAKLQFESDRMKTRYDTRVNQSGFEENDKVWFYNPRRVKGRSPKLQKSWEGPYKIITRLNDITYRIQKTPKAKMKIVHVERLAKFHEREGIT